MSKTRTVVELYVDGGVAGKNPSTIGGSWCYVHVSADGRQITSASGTVTPEQAGCPTGTVSNNYTELLAAVEGLDSLPDGWAGTVYTDSIVTLYRISRDKPKFLNIPDQLINRLRAVRQRLGAYRVVLLRGHPTEADLARGHDYRGNPVSRHNAFCDRECQRRARELRRRK